MNLILTAIAVIVNGWFFQINFLLINDKVKAQKKKEKIQEYSRQLSDLLALIVWKLGKFSPM